MGIKYLDSQPKSSRIKYVDDVPRETWKPEDYDSAGKVALQTAKGTLGTIAKSGGKLVGDIATAVTHPVETVKGVTGAVVGGAQKLIPGKQAQEPIFEGLVDVYKDRYGSGEKAFKTVSEDPIGFLSDIAAGVGGVGLVAKGSKVGSVASKLATSIDPLTQATRGVGAIAKGATKGKKIAPFAGKVDPEVVKAAKETGVDLPASAKTTSRIVPQVESMAIKGMFGQDLVDKIDNAKVTLSKYADDVISKTNASPDLTSAGRSISEGVEAYRSNFMKIKNELYEKATIPVKAGKGQEVIRVNPQESLGFITDILADKKRAAELLGKADDIAYFGNIKSKLTNKAVLPKELSHFRKKVMDSPDFATFVANNPGYEQKFLSSVYKRVKNSQVDARTLHSAIKELNNKISNITDPVATGNKGTLKKLVTLLANDLDNAITTQRPDLAKAIESANQFYSEGISKLNSGYGKKIADLADSGQYDKILPAIINQSTSIEDIPKIYEIVGQQNVPGVQSAFLNRLFQDAKNLEGEFSPTGMTAQINRFGGDKKLSAILTPEQFKAVKNIETVAKSFGNLNKISGGSQTAFLARIATEVGLLFSNPVLGLKLIAGDALASKFIASPQGQAILGQGVQLTGRTGQGIMSKAPAVGKVGGALRIEGQRQEGEQ